MLVELLWVEGASDDHEEEYLTFDVHGGVGHTWILAASRLTRISVSTPLQQRLQLLRRLLDAVEPTILQAIDRRITEHGGVEAAAEDASHFLDVANEGIFDQLAHITPASTR